jgi:hypothetical protein
MFSVNNGVGLIISAKGGNKFLLDGEWTMTITPLHLDLLTERGCLDRNSCSRSSKDASTPGSLRVLLLE